MSGRRDPRLDIWRGLAMYIIFVSHIQANPWAFYIPANFGPSDAAEMFVFCSGYAAAIAFGGTFAKLGFWMGTRRILFRCWQIYWSHLGLFFAIAVVTVIITAALGPTAKNYVGKLNLEPFFDDTAMNLVGLFTLTYVPNYFDILPMYLVILLMTPIVVGLQRFGTRYAVAFCLGLYLCVLAFGWNLPAEPWDDRKWFFNPLAWQLLFFTGFALARGWLPVPPFKWWLVLAAILFLIACVAVFHWPIYREHPWLKAIHDVLWISGVKTNQHPIRYVHVLALTFVAVWLVRGREHWLLSAALSPVRKVGQQALATFMTSMMLSWLATIFLDQLGRSALTLTFVNVGGLLLMTGVAYMVSWYKREPWRQRPPPASASAASAP